VNYLDEIARAIHRAAEGHGRPTPADLALHRIYAVLCLSVGGATTNEMVHHAWAAWRSATLPEHPSIVPFDQLDEAVQDLDTPYRNAIRTVAAQRAAS
jgi:hypothetical protein